MHAEFWHSRWQQQQIGFHLATVNPLLQTYLGHLGLSPGQRIFVPLCGKSLDLGWLLAQGYAVVGVELSPLAVQALFAALGVTPEVTAYGALQHYRAGALEVFQGDVFALSPAHCGPVHAVYDRAALVALPEDMRAAYCRHLCALTDYAPQLLVSFDYDPARHPGPPFSVPAALLQRYYAADYQLTLLADLPVAGGLKGGCPAQEQVWHLSPRAPGSAS